MELKKYRAKMKQDSRFVWVPCIGTSPQNALIVLTACEGDPLCAIIKMKLVDRKPKKKSV